MRCAIVQPSYIPWRGYFDLIRRSDVFVFYDDVQFDKHGWRNRNRIKTSSGPAWLTIPVRKKGNVERGLRIDEIEISNERRWQDKHLASLRQSYARAPHLEPYMALVEEYLESPPELLADLTIPLTISLAKELGLEPRFVRSSALQLEGDRNERLLSVLRQVEATSYLSGPSAASYLDDEAMGAAGIALDYIQYDYPEYQQLHPPFEGQVTILDALFMLGPDASRQIWGGG